MTVSPPEAGPQPAGAGGAAPAMGRLVDRAGPALHALALRIAGTASDAHDVLEQTFIEAWERNPETTAEASFVALARRCRDLALVRSGRRPIGRVRLRTMRAPPSGRGTAALDLDAARAAVLRALASLAPAERLALDLVGFEGYDVTDLGTRAGPGRAATRADLRRAIAALPRLAPVTALLALSVPPAPLDSSLGRRLLAAARRRAHS
ncbi:MAG TPA: hypothetical protein VI792_01075 [Candidatus Eisenbacteria bacterium]